MLEHQEDHAKENQQPADQIGKGNVQHQQRHDCQQKSGHGPERRQLFTGRLAVQAVIALGVGLGLFSHLLLAQPVENSQTHAAGWAAVRLRGQRLRVALDGGQVLQQLVDFVQRRQHLLAQGGGCLFSPLGFYQCVGNVLLHPG